MKKNVGVKLVIIFLILFNISFTYGAVPELQEVTVTIPDFDIRVNGVLIDTVHSQYPVITYNNITYFPMTYDYLTGIGLDLTFNSDDGLRINTKSEVGALEQNFLGASNVLGSTHKAQIASFPIEVNGKKIDNTKEEYPILLYKSITYFPMTWRFAVTEFGWKTSWSSETGFGISIVKEPVTFDIRKELAKTKSIVLEEDVVIELGKDKWPLYFDDVTVDGKGHKIIFKIDDEYEYNCTGIMLTGKTTVKNVQFVTESNGGKISYISIPHLFQGNGLNTDNIDIRFENVSWSRTRFETGDFSSHVTFINCKLEQEQLPYENHPSIDQTYDIYDSTFAGEIFPEIDLNFHPDVSEEVKFEALLNTGDFRFYQEGRLLTVDDYIEVMENEADDNIEVMENEAKVEGQEGIDEFASDLNNMNFSNQKTYVLEEDVVIELGKDKPPLYFDDVTVDGKGHKIIFKIEDEYQYNCIGIILTGKTTVKNVQFVTESNGGKITYIRIPRPFEGRGLNTDNIDITFENVSWSRTRFETGSFSSHVTFINCKLEQEQLPYEIHSRIDQTYDIYDSTFAGETFPEIDLNIPANVSEEVKFEALLNTGDFRFYQEGRLLTVDDCIEIMENEAKVERQKRIDEFASDLKNMDFSNLKTYVSIDENMQVMINSITIKEYETTSKITVSYTLKNISGDPQNLEILSIRFEDKSSQIFGGIYIGGIEPGHTTTLNVSAFYRNNLLPVYISVFGFDNPLESSSPRWLID